MPLDTIRMRRTVAADLIDRVREMLAERATPEAIEERLKHDFSVPPLRPCDGQAHSNPNIDNCGRCMPRWGVIGARIQVR